MNIPIDPNSYSIYASSCGGYLRWRVKVLDLGRERVPLDHVRQFQVIPNAEENSVECARDETPDDHHLI